MIKIIETKSERVLPVLSLCEKCRKNLIATLQMCTKGVIVEPSGDTINVTMNGNNNTMRKGIILIARSGLK